ncbi:MAG: Trp operon repressor [Gammaproteobacteria bacterium RIFCSPHIGHO2_12_FULL_41_15]|nr:MAG: Trp operon repressor [Gammaproteobacteria bacterium RIFCSPHIGHO2_12_FULL_41_15]
MEWLLHRFHWEARMDQEGWRYFLALCLAAQDEKTLSELLDLLLTPEEKVSLEMRCLVIKALLEQKKPQRQISEDLKVSIAKITRGSNELKRISPRLKEYLRKHLLGFASRDVPRK